MKKPMFVELAAKIVTAHVTNNDVAIDDIPALIAGVHSALVDLTRRHEEAPPKRVPAVSVRASVKPDYLICLNCGRKQKTMRLHLRTSHGMTPEQYRREYGLLGAYPMTAPNYSEKRKALAKTIGLGRKPEPKPRRTLSIKA